MYSATAISSHKPHISHFNVHHHPSLHRLSRLLLTALTPFRHRPPNQTHKAISPLAASHPQHHTTSQHHHEHQSLLHSSRLRRVHGGLPSPLERRDACVLGSGGGVAASSLASSCSSRSICRRIRLRAHRGERRRRRQVDFPPCAHAQCLGDVLPVQREAWCKSL